MLKLFIIENYDSKMKIPIIKLAGLPSSLVCLPLRAKRLFDRRSKGLLPNVVIRQNAKVLPLTHVNGKASVMSIFWSKFFELSRCLSKYSSVVNIVIFW